MVNYHYSESNENLFASGGGGGGGGGGAIYNEEEQEEQEEDDEKSHQEQRKNSKTQKLKNSKTQNLGPQGDVRTGCALPLRGQYRKTTCTSSLWCPELVPTRLICHDDVDSPSSDLI